MRATKKYCHQQYKKINRLVYRKRLPKRVKFRFVDPDALADVVNGTKSGVVIRIHPRLVWCDKLVLRELIHEIAHVAHPRMAHGRRFENEMMRIKRKVYKGPVW